MYRFQKVEFTEGNLKERNKKRLKKRYVFYPLFYFNYVLYKLIIILTNRKILKAKAKKRNKEKKMNNEKKINK